jgi:hypothetical protein
LLGVAEAPRVADGVLVDYAQVMVERIRHIPAWCLALGFGVAAIAADVAVGAPDDGAAPLIIFTLLIVALAGALIARGTGDGWSILGIMVVVSLVLQALHWPKGVEAVVFLSLTTVVIWLVFDRGRAGQKADG